MVNKQVFTGGGFKSPPLLMSIPVAPFGRVNMNCLDQSLFSQHDRMYTKMKTFKFVLTSIL